MATVPLGKRDCVRASQAVRREAIRLIFGDAADLEEAAALRGLADRLEAAGELEGAGPLNDRPRPAVQAVDTFPTSHAEAAAWGDSPHDQEPR